VAFTTERIDVFALLQSRIHEVWTRSLSSTMKDDLSYVPSDCFDTFPLPGKSDGQSRLADALTEVANIYYDYRSNLMREFQVGLTGVYNLFHDPDEGEASIVKFRDIHDELDRAVLDAYGWSDMNVHCEFLLDFEESNESSGNKRKKPWRYRWPDLVQDDILARLLELNRRRAESERERGSAATVAREPEKRGTSTGARAKVVRRKSSGSSKAPPQRPLAFEEEDS